MQAPEPAARAAQDLLRACALPPFEARALLCRALGVTRERLVAHPEIAVDRAAGARFAQWVQRRQAGEPMAYLLGEQEFYGHAFHITPAVLVPRPETELLVDSALSLLAGRPGARVLELGTGSGCIAISLGLARADLVVVATDRSIAALDVARANCRRLGAAVQLVAADWYAPLVGRFDLIISNPPYIALGDAHLPALACEPAAALTSGTDGLDDLRRIVAGAPAYLATDGSLLVEHGHDQGAAVREFFAAAGLGGVATIQDLAGRDRACRGTSMARNR